MATSFWDFFKQSICAVIPKPEDALPSSQRYSPQRLQTITTMLNRLPSSTLPRPPVLTKTTNRLQVKAEQRGIDKFYRDLRNVLDCGDRYNICKTDSDCGSNTLTCFQNQCVPSSTHCVNTGCATGKECNTQTGECNSIINSCNSDLDCPTGQQCEDNQCKNVSGRCQSDLQCINYSDIEGYKNKCDLETQDCVECLPYQPSICGNAQFGKAGLPQCDELINKCFLGCDYNKITNTFDNAGTAECCKVERINPNLPHNSGKQRKSDCCERQLKATGSWNGLSWSGGSETCYVKPESALDRNCTLPFGGKTPNKITDPNNQCESGYICDWTTSSGTFGQCV